MQNFQYNYNFNKNKNYFDNLNNLNVLITHECLRIILIN